MMEESICNGNNVWWKSVVCRVTAMHNRSVVCKQNDNNVWLKRVNNDMTYWLLCTLRSGEFVCKSCLKSFLEYAWYMIVKLAVRVSEKRMLGC